MQRHNGNDGEGRNGSREQQLANVVERLDAALEHNRIRGLGLVALRELYENLEASVLSASIVYPHTSRVVADLSIKGVLVGKVEQDSYLSDANFYVIRLGRMGQTTPNTAPIFLSTHEFRAGERSGSAGYFHAELIDEPDGTTTRRPDGYLELEPSDAVVALARQILDLSL